MICLWEGKTFMLAIRYVLMIQNFTIIKCFTIGLPIATYQSNVPASPSQWSLIARSIFVTSVDLSPPVAFKYHLLSIN